MISGRHLAAEEAFAAALLQPQAAPPVGLRTWNGSDAARRYGVHRNNVTASLVAALVDTFPVVQDLVGTEFFAAMALMHVRQSPPHSPVLVRYGSGFADFIDGFGPAAGLAYLADVARLEFARVEAFHAADAAPLDAVALQALAGVGERAALLVLHLHPSVRVLASAHPIVSIWAAHQGMGELAEVDLDEPECALVVRPQLDVLVMTCDKGTAAFMHSLLLRQALASSAAAALDVAPSFDLAACLSKLGSLGLLCGVSGPAAPSP